MPLPLDLSMDPQERVLRQFVEALVFEGIATPAESEGASEFSTFHLGDTELQGTFLTGPFGRPRLRIASLRLRCQATGNWQRAAVDTLTSLLPAPADIRNLLLQELKSTIVMTAQDASFPLLPDRRTLPFERLDCALGEAHPYHPCFKSRTGFSTADNARFGPEAGRHFRLFWLAVQRDHVREALPADTKTFWSAEIGTHEVIRLIGLLAKAGVSIDTHALLPVHPWQFQHLERGTLSTWIDGGRVVPLGEAGPFYAATQSIRTLVNTDAPEHAHVKLPLSIVNTSAMRILEPHSIATAPHLSAWLAGVIASDTGFESRYPLAILREYAGVRVDPEGQLDGLLGVMLRESPVPKLSAGEQAVPFNALMMIEKDGAPFIRDWVARHGLGPWLQRMIEVSVLPVWHLLVDHGIALEAHGQNMILIVRDGWPERLILRDFHESVEYCPALLKAPELLPDFAAIDPVYDGAPSDAYYWTDHPNELRELVMDCLFIYCLTEVSLLIETVYGFAETDFWRLVAQILDAYGMSYPDKTRLALFAHDEPQISTESLLSRKLFRNRQTFRHLVPNPLCQSKRSI